VHRSEFVLNVFCTKIVILRGNGESIGQV